MLVSAVGPLTPDELHVWLELQSADLDYTRSIARSFYVRTVMRRTAHFCSHRTEHGDMTGAQARGYAHL